MTHTDALIWRAIEGALGPEKRAFLEHAPLSEIVGGDASMSLADSIGAISASASHKHAEAASIRSGLQALGMVAKEASVQREEPFPEKVARAYKLQKLGPLCSGGVKQAADQERRRLNVDIMATVKTAGVGPVLSGAASGSLLGEFGKKMLQGAGVATGAAVPTYLAGSALSDKFTEDARNRALQTAGGAAGIGLLGYGGKKLIDQLAMQQQPASRQQPATKLSASKVAGDVCVTMHVGPEKVAHLATTVYLDELLSSVPQTQKVAALRDLNNEFLTELLATSEKTANVMRRLTRMFEPPPNPIGKITDFRKVKTPADEFQWDQRQRLMSNITVPGYENLGQGPVANITNPRNIRTPADQLQWDQRQNLLSNITS